MSADGSIEVTGESVEEAINKGLKELNARPNEVIVEILEEPSRGVFGLGAHPARVRLRLMAARPAPAVAVEPILSRSIPTLTSQPAPAAASSTDQMSDQDVEEGLSLLAEADSDFDGETTDADAAAGKAALAELLAKMHITASVTARRTEPAKRGENTPWILEVTGDELGVLIGRRGETLAALQYITRLVASRELERRANIIVDVEGYKSRRAKMLQKLALRMAEQAIQQERTVTLEPMPSYERRIIHLTLHNNPDVRTESVGEGEARKITIIPNVNRRK